MAQIGIENESGVAFAAAADEVRERTIVSLEEAIVRIGEKTGKAKADYEAAKAALVAVKGELAELVGPKGIAAHAAVVEAGTAFENRSPAEKAADTVAVARAALDQALAAEKQAQTEGA